MEENVLKNIVIVNDYAYVEGGASKVAIQTAIALSHYTEFNVYFFAGSGLACEELKNSKVIIIELNMYDLIGNPSKVDAMIHGVWNHKAAIELKRLLINLETSKTIVHVHTWTKVLTSSIFDVTRKLNIRTYLTMHDYFLVCPNGGCYNYVRKEICTINPMSVKCLACNCDSRNYYYKVWRILRQYRQRLTMKKCDNIIYIYISQFSKKQLLLRNSKISPLFFLNNPCEFPNRHRIYVENNELYLFIGRVTPEKGVDLFCEAIRKSGAKGVVIGNGPLYEELKNRYAEITFTGWIEQKEVNKWLLKCRCLVFSSRWYEGAPLTILEAQAYGIPCIVSNCSAAIDVIHNKKNGLVFDVNAFDIVDKIKKFEDDLVLKKASITSYEMFDEKTYKLKTYVSELLKIYSKNGR